VVCKGPDITWIRDQRGENANDALVPARRDELCLGERRIICLAGRIIAPSHDGAVVAQRQAVGVASRDTHGVGQIGRNIGLAAGIITPGDDRSVR